MIIFISAKIITLDMIDGIDKKCVYNFNLDKNWYRIKSD